MDELNFSIKSTDLDITLDYDALASSTPRKAKAPSRRGQSTVTSSPFKKPAPAPKRQQGPVIATCDRCGAEYRTLRYYKRHVQGHQLKELSSRVPTDFVAVNDKCLEIASKCLEVLASKPEVYGQMGQEYKQAIEDLKQNQEDDFWKEVVTFLATRFCTILSSEKFTMPSAMMCSALLVVDNILTDINDRDFITSRLSTIISCSDNVHDSLLSEFVFTFSDQLLIFVFRSLRDAERVPNQVKEIVFDEEDRQSIFYVGGSICHSLKQMGVRYPNSKKWQAIVVVLDKKIIAPDFYEYSEQYKLDKKWTEQRNRGGLMFVTEHVQSFLISVAKIIVSEMKPDGSLPVDIILEKVVVSHPKYDWDTAVGNSLDPDLSLTVMIGVVKSLLSTYGKGIIKMHLNRININSATVSITLRHKVAPH